MDSWSLYSTVEKVSWKRILKTLPCCYFFKTMKSSIDCAHFPIPLQDICSGLHLSETLTKQLSSRIGLLTWEVVRRVLSPCWQAESCCSWGRLADQECLCFLLLCFRTWSCSMKPVISSLYFMYISLFFGALDQTEFRLALNVCRFHP